MNSIDLQGLRVLNTRPLGQHEDLDRLIKEAGGQPLHCPALTIEAPRKPWFHLIPNFNSVSQAIFISSNAVSFAMDIFLQKKLLWPSHIIVTAIGKATASALDKYQITVANLPIKSDSEHLLQLTSLQAIHNQTILLLKGEGGRTLIRDTLRNRGAEVVELNVYQRKMPAQLEKWQFDEEIDIIVFTSEESIKNIFSLFGEKTASWLKQRPALVISKRLAEAAANFGIKNINICSSDTILEGLHQFKRKRSW